MTVSRSISIVIPVYNEEDGILDFHYKILLPAIDKLVHNFEITYINDGSRDNSLKYLHDIAAEDKRVKIVSLSKNFGKEIATSAGIFHSSGDATIIMDADGQHPPKIINKFINKWLAGAQVVIGIRIENQKEGFIKRYGSKAFYRILNSITSDKIIPRSTDYRLIDAEVRKSFIKFTERDRITRGLIDWLGYKRDYIEFNAPARLAGEASYSISKLTKLAINSFVSLTLKPLFFFGYLGLFIMIGSILLGLFIIVEQIILNDPLSLNFTGTAMLGVFISFLVSLVLTSQAMIAVYLSHIYSQTRERPIFVVNEAESVNLLSEK